MRDTEESPANLSSQSLAREFSIYARTYREAVVIGENRTAPFENRRTEGPRNRISARDKPKTTVRK